LIDKASEDPTVKVILLHGGKYYGSGNNLKGLMKGLAGDEK
jgi:enoyl-CoA hydratase/carnithine racemase